MSNKETETYFASWSKPDSSIRVNYPLPLFHEIDFTVNEGYRRIPHGGVEVGGVLFGRLVGQTVQIEQSRPIVCEYAHGPSFVLSDQDAAKLRQQLIDVETDPELNGFVPVGWFIGHTRHPLKMGEGESAFFDELFPHAGQLTLLVKPERFKPTLFGFIVRGADRRYENDASANPFILPLSSRGESVSVAPPEELPLTKEPLPTEAPAVPVIPEPASQHFSIRAEPLPSLNDIRRRRLENLPNSHLPFSDNRPVEASRRPLPRESEQSNKRAVVLTFLTLACVAALAYWSYLQLFVEAIPIRVEMRGERLFVDWPDSQTKRLPLATLQIGAQPPILLNSEQKQAGQAAIESAGNDVRVELVVHHWYQNRRGIVRFLKTPPPVIAKPIVR